MAWGDCSDFRKECVSHWTKMFATDGVVYAEPLCQNFLAFVDHMSCSAETYVSLSGSNGCADQLTNWDGTQKMGLGAPKKEEGTVCHYRSYLCRIYLLNNKLLCVSVIIIKSVC